MALELPPEPWHSFFLELDAGLSQAVQLHCLGGFVMSMLYGMLRPTADVDVLSAVPDQEVAPVQGLAGYGSPLHKRHGVYLQFVGVANVPENYSDRLVEMFPDAYSRVRLFGLEAYDLALSKLERNAPRDREDVKYLVRAVPLDLGLLYARYRAELRPYLPDPDRHDLTMRLWHEAALEG